ncbi:PEP-CTERM sorting domain-containing protein [Accumulibacter sp.]|uniref:PEP-CTERM sorting domain-containing protein n=1 Tax=Accumulibacter sp. TaxID=2053492 RepID=UPI002619E350|nr:PEP-CTERM sorting domain-containing protein [Accumulibacter sp.]
MFRIGFMVRALVASLASVVLLGGAAQAVTVKYLASDLADLVVGQDRWSYAYQLSGSFGFFEGINLLYPAADYANLDLTSPPDPALWSSLITPPDPSFPADGLLGISALAVLSPVDLPFTLEFTWLGSGSPDAQSFEVVDDRFNVVAVGRTTPAGSQSLPEPGSLLLLASALGLLRCRQRRSS